MFIPVWGLVVLGFVWVASMLHMNKTGFEAGWKGGVQEGIVSTVNFFRTNNVIVENDDNVDVIKEDE